VSDGAGSGNRVMIQSYGSSAAPSSTALSVRGKRILTFNEGSVRRDGTQTIVPFTGAHQVAPLPHSDPSSRKRLAGRILVSTGRMYQTSLSHTIPNARLSMIPSDKRAYGVYNPSPNGHLPLVNAVGEGGIWVCDENGPLAVGDMIVTSSLAGYGMRQADGRLRASTVGKALMGCDFERVVRVRYYVQEPVAAGPEAEGEVAEGGEVTAEGGEVAAEGGEVAAEGGEGGEVAAEGGEVAAEGGEGGEVAAESTESAAPAAEPDPAAPSAEADPAAPSAEADPAVPASEEPAAPATEQPDPEPDAEPEPEPDVDPSPAIAEPPFSEVDQATYEAALAEGVRKTRVREELLMPWAARYLRKLEASPDEPDNAEEISYEAYCEGKAAGEPVYRAAFLGCVYHCG
jgi:hypothetical protein